MTDIANDEGPLTLRERVGRLEWRLPDVDTRSKRTSERMGAVELATARTAQEVEEARKDVTELRKTLDRLVWAVVMLALTIAGSAIGLAISLAAGGGNGP